MKMEPAHKTLTLTVPNGVLKKHQQQTAVYRECLKNHAASLGGHSLDGYGEFMASPSSNPSDPTSLTCAACGCHRNFHRRFLHHSLPPPPSQPQQHPPQLPPRQQQHRSNEDEDEDDVGIDHGETSSAPNMLMALSAAVGTAAAAQVQDQNQQQLGSGSRKRFRTKFTTAQKEGMIELSERIRWRMQKREEGLVEEKCREIGVGRGVFKVWMHNNKHSYFPSPRSASAVPTATNSSIAALSDRSNPAGIIVGGNNVGANVTGSAMDTS